MAHMMLLDNEICLDAKKNGDLVLHVNHSCDPHCYANKWMVEGNLRLVMFSKHNIKLGEELTFDYQWDMSKSINPTKFHCMLCDCRGFLEKEADILS